MLLGKAIPGDQVATSITEAIRIQVVPEEATRTHRHLMVRLEATVVDAFHLRDPGMVAVGVAVEGREATMVHLEVVEVVMDQRVPKV